jgi:hypothetical protein
MQTYLDLARQGKNEWWRFLAAVILILFLWQFVGAVPGMILIFWTQLDGNPGTNITPQGPVGVNLLVYFAAMMFASILFLAGIALAVRWIHERPLRTLITPAPRFAWGRFLQGFLVWLLISGVVAGLEGVLHPGRYKLTCGSTCPSSFWPSCWSRSRPRPRSSSSGATCCRASACGCEISGC